MSLITKPKLKAKLSRSKMTSAKIKAQWTKSESAQRRHFPEIKTSNPHGNHRSHKKIPK